MAIELDPPLRAEAVRSIERWFRENMDEPIGNVAASGLLGFFLEEIAPLVYNQAVADVQQRLAVRVAELDIEVHEQAFGYWRKFERKARPK